ncbi:uncharacterized protein BJX67DRAFT_144283 [Aspergillus lucknowensis]|uniref:Uncharacterized protein n=1 Tax=Aspergillus lucknowensis TaxID=176173 RepID=A0ABR4LP26_9EURO
MHQHVDARRRRNLRANLHSRRGAWHSGTSGLRSTCGAHERTVLIARSPYLAGTWLVVGSWFSVVPSWNDSGACGWDLTPTLLQDGYFATCVLRSDCCTFWLGSRSCRTGPVGLR